MVRAVMKSPLCCVRRCSSLEGEISQLHTRLAQSEQSYSELSQTISTELHILTETAGNTGDTTPYTPPTNPDLVTQISVSQ